MKKSIKPYPSSVHVDVTFMRNRTAISEHLECIFLAKKRVSGPRDVNGLLTVSFHHFGLTAAELSRLAGKNPPWSARALQSVYVGTLKPGRKLEKAIHQLALMLEGENPTLLDVEEVTVLAPRGRIMEGCLVLAAARPCFRPGCKTAFVPSMPSQKYCSDFCRRANRKRC